MFHIRFPSVAVGIGLMAPVMLQIITLGPTLSIANVPAQGLSQFENTQQDATECQTVELSWINVMSAEEQEPHVLVVTMCPSVEKHLILVESVTGMIPAAMLAETLVQIALGDSWTPAEYVAETISLVQAATVF
jgi:hypothetical protein